MKIKEGNNYCDTCSLIKKCPFVEDMDEYRRTLVWEKEFSYRPYCCEITISCERYIADNEKVEEYEVMHYGGGRK